MGGGAGVEGSVRGRGHRNWEEKERSNREGGEEGMGRIKVKFLRKL